MPCSSEKKNAKIFPKIATFGPYACLEQKQDQNGQW